MIATLQLRIEGLQERAVLGEEVSHDDLIRLSSEHRRLLNIIMNLEGLNGR
jgi:hypothetical protein